MERYFIYTAKAPTEEGYMTATGSVACNMFPQMTGLLKHIFNQMKESGKPTDMPTLSFLMEITKDEYEIWNGDDQGETPESSVATEAK